MSGEMNLKICMGFLMVVALVSCAQNQVRPDAAVEAGSSADKSAKKASAGIVDSDREDMGGRGQEARASGSDSQTSSNEAARGESGSAESNKKVQQLNGAIKNQQDEEIFRAASQILFDSPNDLRALNAMALYNYKRGRFLAAEYLLYKAIAQHPNSNEVHSNLGVVFLAQKKDREAIGEFRKALEINSDDPVASANLGSIFVMQKDYTKAQIVLETVYKKGWKDSKALTNYAIALTAVGKFDKSEEIYKTIIREQNSNKEVLFNYAILQIDHLHKFAEGLETINRLKFIGPPGESRKRLAALEAKAKAGK